MLDRKEIIRKALIKAYGMQLKDRGLDRIIKKITVVIAAHLFANSTGSDAMNELNRILDAAIKKVN